MMLGGLRAALQALKLGKNMQGPAQVTRLLAPSQQAGARFAGSPGFFKKAGNFLSPGDNMTKLDYLTRFGPDVFFGGVAALQTPGDLTDKALAFGTAAGGGALGGLTASGLTRHLGKGRINPKDLSTAMGFADMAGSFAGDFGAYPIGDALMRGKDKLVGGLGETPFERLNRGQQQEYAQAMEQQILAQYGLLPGSRGDDYLRQLGLA